MRGVARTIRLYVSIALLALALLFILQNTGPVDMNFLLGTTRVRLVFLLLAALVIGFVAGLVLGSVWSPRKRKATSAGPPVPKGS